MFMLKWDSISKWGGGRRTGGNGARRPRVRLDARSRDRARADRGPVPAADRAAHRPHRRRRGARAVVHRRSADELFARAAAAGLDERLSRLVQRKALRCAAVWEGPLKGLKLSLNLLPQDISRDGYRPVAARRDRRGRDRSGAGHGRDHRKRAAGRPGRGRRAPGAAARRRASASPSTISAPATRASPI